MRFLIRYWVFMCLLAAPAYAADFKLAQAALARGDYQTALENLQPFADKGKPDALYLLGTLYANGDGVDQDDARAAYYFRAAAAKGNKPAAQHLVAMFRLGLLPAPEDGWRIQLAIVPNEAAAKREWRRLTKAYGEVLGGVEMIAAPDEDNQRIRVQGGPLDEPVARAICATFKGTAQTCRVISRPAG